jgi:alpha-1,6-mannosyltransferase
MRDAQADRPAILPFAASCRALYWAGAGLLGLLLATLVFHHSFADRSHQAVRQCLYAALAVGLAYAYLRGYKAMRACPDASRTLPPLVGFGAAMIVAAVFIRPFHSDDVYCYINIGWLQAHYGLDPYTQVPTDIPGWQQDPMLCAEWSHTRAAYGFLFTGLCKLLCWAGDGSPRATLLLFKTVNAIVFALTAWVVWLGCRRMPLPRPERGLYLFLWNPLLLLHVIGNGHNDLLMGLSTATAVYLAICGTWFWVLPALVAGALVKFGSAVLLPFALLYLVRSHGWREATLSAAGALLVGVFIAAPWIDMDGRLSVWSHLATNSTAIHDSLPALVYFPFGVLTKLLPSLKACNVLVIATIKSVFWAGFLGLFTRVAWLRLRDRAYEPARFVRDCLLLQFVLVCVVSSKYYVWYLGMFFPLALWVSADDWLRRATLALSCAQLLAFTFIDRSHGLNEVLMLVVPIAWAIRPMLLPQGIATEEAVDSAESPATFGRQRKAA